jgi:hypothetical protein
MNIKENKKAGKLLSLPAALGIYQFRSISYEDQEFLRSL